MPRSVLGPVSLVCLFFLGESAQCLSKSDPTTGYSFFFAASSRLLFAIGLPSLVPIASREEPGFLWPLNSLSPHLFFLKAHVLFCLFGIIKTTEGWPLFSRQVLRPSRVPFAGFRSLGRINGNQETM